jgi:hypothetical protein
MKKENSTCAQSPFILYTHILMISLPLPLTTLSGGIKTIYIFIFHFLLLFFGRGDECIWLNG